MPGMQAAFVEIGLERTAFLHAADIAGSRRRARSGDTAQRPPACPQSRTSAAWSNAGEDILVQVVKDPIGTKGARLTTFVALPSRYLVLLPHGAGDRRLRAHRGRGRARAAEGARDAAGPAARRGGYIVRTHARGRATGERCARTSLYLRKLWQHRARAARSRPTSGSVVHEDLPLPLRVLRDLTGATASRKCAWTRANTRACSEFAAAFMPELARPHRAVPRRAPDLRPVRRRGRDRPALEARCR